MHDRNSSEEHTDVSYEKSDARGGIIIASGVLLAVLVLLAMASAGWVFDYLKEREQRKYQPLPSLAAKQRVHLPRDLEKIPEPRLQVSEPVDLAKLRQEENSLLSSYGWLVDREKGTARIPDEIVRMLADPKTAEAKGVRVRSLKEGK